MALYVLCSQWPILASQRRLQWRMKEAIHKSNDYLEEAA